MIYIAIQSPRKLQDLLEKSSNKTTITMKSRLLETVVLSKLLMSYSEINLIPKSINSKFRSTRNASLTLEHGKMQIP